MRWLIVSLILLIFSSSCEETDECKDCDLALQHMGSKIVNQACNPNTMQNAWQRIKDDCGGYSENLVGYMAETCYLTDLKVPGCASKLAVHDDIKLRMFFYKGLTNDSMIIIMSNNTAQEDFKISKDEAFEVSFGIGVLDNDVLQFILQRRSTGETLDTEYQRFSFARNGDWNTVRAVEVNYNTIVGYHLVFFNW